MSASKLQVGQRVVIRRENFSSLIEALRAAGYRVIGPVLRDQAVVYDEVERVEDLPAGWTDEQAPGSYRLKKQADGALFGFVVGPNSWKSYLHPPVARLWKASRPSQKWTVSTDHAAPAPMAFLGVRACELHAIAIQDKILTGDNWVDSIYQERRNRVFTVAVNCTRPGGSCFCASMNTGPRATFGFDLALTELVGKGQHDFVVEVGTNRGAKLLKEVGWQEPAETQLRAAEQCVARAAKQMGRSLRVEGIKELLYRNYEHPRWEDVAGRCLTCANCTLVCPTCFCTTVEDVTDLPGTTAERWRKWDSCFTTSFSYIHGGSVRASPKSRYRQWLTHKLATWIDQFGTSGCVGCGRCITWCPAAIDLTEEIRAIQRTDGATLAKD